MSFSFGASGGGLDHNTDPYPPMLQSTGDAALDELQEDMARQIPADYDVTFAQRRLADAQAARDAAQVSAVQSAGIQPDLTAIHPTAGPEGDLRPPAKKFRIENSSNAVVLVRKIYSSDAAGTGATTDRTASGGKPDAEPWMRYFHGRFHELPPIYQDRLREHFARQATVHRMLDAKYNSGNLFAQEDQDDTAGSGEAASHFNLLASLCSFPQLAIEIGTHLRPRDLVRLYSVSRHFHKLVDDYLTSSMSAWAHAMAPASAGLFPYQWYEDLCVPDPTGRPADPGQYHLDPPLLSGRRPPVQNTSAFANGKPGLASFVRSPSRRVPSFQWLHMVVGRETRVRDILACLARAGHRVPPGTDRTLKKMWLVMDVATNLQRKLLVTDRNFITDVDLFNFQLFFVKLGLRLNDPLYSTGSTRLAQALLGQRSGLTPLWKLLRRRSFCTLREVVQLQVEYNHILTGNQIQTALPVFGVPIDAAGVGHLEGWGLGSRHLMRPDELVVAESIRRQLGLDTQLESMMIYGRVDLSHDGRGASLVPTLDEMYMSDEDLDEVAPEHERGIHGGCGNVPFEDSDWSPKLARKARWNQLSQAERDAIIADDRDEILRSQAWDDLSELDFEPEPDDFGLAGYPDGGDHNPLAANAPAHAHAQAERRSTSYGSATTASAQRSMSISSARSVASADSSDAISSASSPIAGDPDLEVLDFGHLSLGRNQEALADAEEQDAPPVTDNTDSSNDMDIDDTGNGDGGHTNEGENNAVAAWEFDYDDEELRALADLDYDEYEEDFGAVDWDGFADGSREDLDQLCRDIFSEDCIGTEGEIERIQKYYRRY